MKLLNLQKQNGNDKDRNDTSGNAVSVNICLLKQQQYVVLFEAKMMTDKRTDEKGRRPN